MVNNSSSFTHILEKIEFDILTGILMPRQRLVENDLMNRFNVNRNVIRKVLKELHVKNLIEHYPNRGATVADPSEKEVKDIYSMRILLENFASALVIKNITKQTFQEVLRSANEFKKAAQQKDFKKMVVTNINFHRKILQTCGNNILSEMIDQLRRRSHLVLHFRWRQAGRGKESVEEHNQMLKAIKNGNATMLKLINEKHLRAGLKSYLETFGAKS